MTVENLVHEEWTPKEGVQCGLKPVANLGNFFFLSGAPKMPDIAVFLKERNCFGGPHELTVVHQGTTAPSLGTAGLL